MALDVLSALQVADGAGTLVGGGHRPSACPVPPDLPSSLPSTTSGRGVQEIPQFAPTRTLLTVPEWAFFTNGCIKSSLWGGGRKKRIR